MTTRNEKAEHASSVSSHPSSSTHTQPQNNGKLDDKHLSKKIESRQEANKRTAQEEHSNPLENVIQQPSSQRVTRSQKQKQGKSFMRFFSSPDKIIYQGKAKKKASKKVASEKTTGDPDIFLQRQNVKADFEESLKDKVREEKESSAEMKSEADVSDPASSMFSCNQQSGQSSDLTAEPKGSKSEPSMPGNEEESLALDSSQKTFEKAAMVDKKVEVPVAPSALGAEDKSRLAVQINGSGEKQPPDSQDRITFEDFPTLEAASSIKVTVSKRPAVSSFRKVAPPCEPKKLHEKIIVGLTTKLKVAKGPLVMTKPKITRTQQLVKTASRMIRGEEGISYASAAKQVVGCGSSSTPNRSNPQTFLFRITEAQLTSLLASTSVSPIKSFLCKHVQQFSNPPMAAIMAQPTSAYVNEPIWRSSQSDLELVAKIANDIEDRLMPIIPKIKEESTLDEKICAAKAFLPIQVFRNLNTLRYWRNQLVHGHVKGCRFPRNHRSGMCKEKFMEIYVRAREELDVTVQERKITTNSRKNKSRRRGRS